MNALLTRFLRNKSANPDSFQRFLLKNSQNKKYLYLAAVGIVVQFIIFKLCYPFADYFTDSYTYINAARHHHSISVRPIGYSRFLEFVHLLTTSDTVVVFIQYLLLQAGALFLFFTIRYFFPLQKTVSRILFGLLVLNPVLLYISNYISSDALFVGVGLFWFAVLVFIINQPRWVHLLLMAGLLFIIFSLRYAALYLPVLALLALLFSRRNWVYIVTGMVITVAPIYLEMQRIIKQTKKETGTAVFSAFGSWMGLNNALHMYPHIQVKDSTLPTPATRELNRIVKRYFDAQPANSRPFPPIRVEYMWNSYSPLKTYMHQVQQQKKIDDYYRGWHAVAPVFSQYSSALIKHYPGAFARYFIWPNAKSYWLPGLESLFSYNNKSNTVDSTAIKWFKYKKAQVRCLNYTVQGSILRPIPYWFLLVNIVFLATLVTVLLSVKHYALPSHAVRTLLLAGAFWAVNFVFSIYAAPIVFRFQLLPMIIYTLFAALLINTMLNRRYQAVAQ